MIHLLQIRQKLNVLVVTLIFLFSMSTAALSDTVSINANTTNNLSNSLARAPRWVFDPQWGAGKDEIAGLGIAKIGKDSIQEARKDAIARAINELALIVSTKVVHSMYDQIKEPIFKVEEMTIISINDLLVKKISKSIIVRESWISEDREVFVLGVIPIDIVKELISLKADSAFKKFINIYMSSSIKDNLTADRILFQIKEDNQWIDRIRYETSWEKMPAIQKTESKNITAFSFPEWAMTGSGAVNGNFVGVGSFPFSESGMDVSITGALALARSEVVKRLSVYLQALLKDYKSSSETGTIGYEDGNMVYQDGAIIAGIQQKDIWINSVTNEVLVLATLNPNIIKLHSADTKLKPKILNAIDNMYKKLNKEETALELLTEELRIFTIDIHDGRVFKGTNTHKDTGTSNTKRGD